jgi:hypothetical protein
MVLFPVKNAPRMKRCLLLLIAVSFVVSVCYAQDMRTSHCSKPGWKKLNEIKVDLKNDNDELLLTGTSICNAIVLKFTNGPVYVGDMEIYYDDKSSENISLSNEFASESESQIIYLKNNGTTIRKIMLYCRSIPNAEADETQIELWGLTNEPLAIF